MKLSTQERPVEHELQPEDLQDTALQSQPLEAETQQIIRHHQRYSIRRSGYYVAIAGLSCILLAPRSSDSGPELVTIGMWNLLWRSLDDPEGQAAVGKALNGAGHLDIFAMVEASGNALGKWPGWVNRSAAVFARGKQHVSGASGFETIAIFYETERWALRWHTFGSFEVGRPFLLALLERLNSARTPLWVMAAHLPHWGSSPPGDAMVSALADAAQKTGRPVWPLVLMGDFNEYGECDPVGRCSHARYRAAMPGIKPLWQEHPQLRAATPFNVTTCCTKWAEGQVDWQYHFDHIFTSFDPGHLAAEQIEYQYPGIPLGACASAACTGDTPPQPVAGRQHLPQGSWHRGWKLSLPLPAS